MCVCVPVTVCVYGCFMLSTDGCFSVAFIFVASTQCFCILCALPKFFDALSLSLLKVVKSFHAHAHTHTHTHTRVHRQRDRDIHAHIPQLETSYNRETAKQTDRALVAKGGKGARQSNH